MNNTPENGKDFRFAPLTISNADFVRLAQFMHRLDKKTPADYRPAFRVYPAERL